MGGKVKIILLEFLVETLEVDHHIIVSRPELRQGKTTVHFTFLNLPPLEFKEESLPIGRYKGQIDFKCGKSCLFSVPDFPVIPPDLLEVNVHVIRELPGRLTPNKILMALTKIDLTPIFETIIIESRLHPYMLPITKSHKECYLLTNINGTRIAGSIGVFIRASCFGKLIVSQFQMSSEEECLFKGAQNRMMYHFESVTRKPKDQKGIFSDELVPHLADGIIQSLTAGLPAGGVPKPGDTPDTSSKDTSAQSGRPSKAVINEQAEGRPTKPTSEGSAPDAEKRPSQAPTQDSSKSPSQLRESPGQPGDKRPSQDPSKQGGDKASPQDPSKRPSQRAGPTQDSSKSPSQIAGQQQDPSKRPSSAAQDRSKTTPQDGDKRASATGETPKEKTGVPIQYPKREDHTKDPCDGSVEETWFHVPDECVCQQALCVCDKSPKLVKKKVLNVEEVGADIITGHKFTVRLPKEDKTKWFELDVDKMLENPEDRWVCCECSTQTDGRGDGLPSAPISSAEPCVCGEDDFKIVIDPVVGGSRTATSMGAGRTVSQMTATTTATSAPASTATALSGTRGTATSVAATTQKPSQAVKFQDGQLVPTKQKEFKPKFTSIKEYAGKSDIQVKTPYDPKNDIFILKICKKGDELEKKPQLELELRTPKRPMPAPVARLTQEVQYDPKDIGGGGGGKGKGKGKGKKGKGKKGKGKKGKGKKGKKGKKK